MLKGSFRLGEGWFSSFCPLAQIPPNARVCFLCCFDLFFRARGPQGPHSEPKNPIARPFPLSMLKKPARANHPECAGLFSILFFRARRPQGPHSEPKNPIARPFPLRKVVGERGCGCGCLLCRFQVFAELFPPALVVFAFAASAIPSPALGCL